MIAQRLLALTSGWNDTDRVNFVISFVFNNISGQEDYYVSGNIHGDYWKLPAETLWEGEGDCEDHAFLFASLIKAMGYRSVIYSVSVANYDKLILNHLANGVAVPGGSGSYIVIDGVAYYYCDATLLLYAGNYPYWSVILGIYLV